MELTKAEKSLHEYSSKQLKKLWRKQQFNEDYQFFLKFYYEKLQKVITIRSERKEQAEGLYDFISDLVYQGYYLGLELLHHPEVKIEDRFLLQNNGLIREQMYDILTNSTENLGRIVTHLESMNYQTKMKEQYPRIEPILEQLKIDATCYGAYHAFLDERSKRDLTIREEDESGLDGLLYRLDDLFFVTPQAYFSCLAASGTSEVWELNIWSGLEVRNRRVGDLHISYFNEEELNKGFLQFPHYQGYEAMTAESPKMIAKVVLDEKMTESEKLFIVDQISKSIMERHTIQAEHLHVTVGSGFVRDTTYYTFNKEKEND